jgi:hypothetical protein
VKPHPPKQTILIEKGIPFPSKKRRPFSQFDCIPWGMLESGDSFKWEGNCSCMKLFAKKKGISLIIQQLAKFQYRIFVESVQSPSWSDAQKQIEATLPTEAKP